MPSFFKSRRFWVLFLVILLSINLFIYWPRKSRPGPSSGERPPGAPPGSGQAGARPGSSQEMREKFQAALQKLPETQRKVVEERMEADRAFFESVKNLPETERREKMKEHFAQNPPPQIPGLEGMGPPPGGAAGGAGGGPDGPGHGGHIPEPQARHGMDQRIVNSQKNGDAQ